MKSSNALSASNGHALMGTYATGHRIHCAAWRVATPRCTANSYAYLRKPVEWEDLIERVRPSLGASAAG